jgi:glyoxylase-like metal-dependent hydrolase (beta-lactamase superfamily II)
MSSKCSLLSAIVLAALLQLLMGLETRADAASNAPAVPGLLRLYVLDCGTIHVADTARYELRRDEVETPELSVACFLVVHPKGALIWDVGTVPDSEWQPTGTSIVHPLSLPDGQTRDITLTQSLGAQLAEIGYTPSKIRYIALSHYHYDHTANANAFAHSTWLVRRVERAAMFGATPPGTTRPDTYAQLKTAKTTLIESDQFDVFGDSSVVIKFAPGHTPGHQMLLVRLKNTGPVLLSGDLYHFPQERTLNRFPVFEFDREQTRRTRVEIDDFLKTTGASLWIQHDFIANRGLRKSPAFYD